MSSQNVEAARNAERAVRHGAHEVSEAKKGGFPVFAGIIAVAVMGIAAIVLFAMLISFGGIPSSWLIIAGAVLAILLVLFAAGCNAKKNGSRILCFCLSLVFAVILIIGAVYFNKAMDTLGNIYHNGGTVSYEMSVIVLADDEAKKLKDAADYTFGILETIDRDNTDKALDKIYEELEVSVAYAGYATTNSLIEALYTGEVGAVILNEGYRSLLHESYPELDTETRVLHSFTHTTESRPQNNAFQQGDKDSAPAVNDDGSINPFVIYLTGIDTYGSTDAASRSDVNILAVVNPSTKQLLLVTTPRDSYVELPTAYNNLDKLTHAALYGGVESSMETLEVLYDINIDYFLRLNFTGFSTIVDAIGGIDVYSEVAFSDFDDNEDWFYFDAGINHLNGEEALTFVRARRPFVDGDFQRGRNQMAAIEAILDKVLSPSILTSYMALMDSVADCFTTSVPEDMIAALVRMQLEDNASWSIESYEVSGWADSAVCYSVGDEVSIVVLDDDSVEEVKSLIDETLNGVR